MSSFSRLQRLEMYLFNKVCRTLAYPLLWIAIVLDSEKTPDRVKIWIENSLQFTLRTAKRIAKGIKFVLRRIKRRAK